MTVKKFIAQQAEMFEKSLPAKVGQNEEALPVITLSMEPGSGGYLIAEKVAARLGFMLYSKTLLTTMANKADIKQSVLEAIEKGRPSIIEDFVASLLPKEGYVYTGDYLEQLKETISHIAMLGKAVIVGRGANFIIPLEKRFSIRVIAPLESRIKNVALHFNVTLEEAKKRVTNREAKRKAFIKDNFRKDIGDAMHYDLIINTERMDLETCTELVIGAIKGSQINRVFEKAGSSILSRK
jgi:cytidylate kinase